MVITSPGRICLFGEHQDYLGLPVIAAAISLRIKIEGDLRSDLDVHIDLPDIASKEIFSLEGDLSYENSSDYFKSGLNVMRKDGFTFSKGFNCAVQGNIPLQAGTSSSSALTVSWINFLANISDQSEQLSPKMIADLAYKAEVVEFEQAGGVMDQNSISYGNLIYIDTHPSVKVKLLPYKLSKFVLGDSLEKKDTQSVLSNSKDKVLKIINKIKQDDTNFSLKNAKHTDLETFQMLDKSDINLLKETLNNRDLTLKGFDLLINEKNNDQLIGNLLSQEHRILRDSLKVSTPKIEKMLKAAKKAGALGGKINGSGGGGCMFVYAPENYKEVAKAIEDVGGKSYIINIDEGTKKHE